MHVFRLTIQAEAEKRSNGASEASLDSVYSDDFLRAPYDEVTLAWRLLEMSGHRVSFVPEFLYVYNLVIRGEAYRHKGILGHPVATAMSHSLAYERLSGARLASDVDPSAGEVDYESAFEARVRIVQPSDAEVCCREFVLQYRSRESA